jgi:hypothetical protein
MIFIAAWEDRSPSVTMAFGQPNRFIVLRRNLNAALRSRRLVTNGFVRATPLERWKSFS